MKGEGGRKRNTGRWKRGIKARRTLRLLVKRSQGLWRLGTSRQWARRLSFSREKSMGENIALATEYRFTFPVRYFRCRRRFAWMYVKKKKKHRAQADSHCCAINTSSWHSFRRESGAGRALSGSLLSLSSPLRPPPSWPPSPPPALALGQRRARRHLQEAAHGRTRGQTRAKKRKLLLSIVTRCPHLRCFVVLMLFFARRKSSTPRLPAHGVTSIP